MTTANDDQVIQKALKTLNDLVPGASQVSCHERGAWDKHWAAVFFAIYGIGWWSNLWADRRWVVEHILSVC